MAYYKEKLNDLIFKYPFINDYLDNNNLNIKGFENGSFEEFIDHFKNDEIEDFAIDKENLLSGFDAYISQMMEFLSLNDNKVQSLTILAGFNKDAKKEKFDEITIYPSEVVAIVGPTGSGKSRLLADIEWAAQNDTPTGRTILINGHKVDKKYRFDIKKKLVAYLSQNMNFVMDLTVDEFLQMHAESRLINNIDEIKMKILNEANRLAGEKFENNSYLTSLSGGQSRALMIADVAILSNSPIVLIDEIENAGIDRKKAIELLISEDKIVFLATHDPYLALSADMRIVIGNGGVESIIKTEKKEKEILKKLAHLDEVIMSIREKLRRGERIENI